MLDTEDEGPVKRGYVGYLTMFFWQQGLSNTRTHRELPFIQYPQRLYLGLCFWQKIRLGCRRTFPARATYGCRGTIVVKQGEILTTLE